MMSRVPPSWSAYPRGCCIPLFKRALVTGLANVAPNVGEGTALPAEGLLGAALTEEVSVVDPRTWLLATPGVHYQGAS